MRIDDACIALDGTDRKSVKGATLIYNCRTYSGVTEAKSVVFPGWFNVIQSKISMYTVIGVHTYDETKYRRTPNMVYIRTIYISLTFKP